MSDEAIDIGAIRIGFVARATIPAETRDRALAALSASWKAIKLKATPTLWLAWGDERWTLRDVDVAPGDDASAVRARALELLRKAGFEVA